MTEHLNMRAPVTELLDRRVRGADPATGEVRLAFTARPEFANRHGSVHGGLLSAMLDSVASQAALYGLPPDLGVVTMRLDTRFHRPAPLGELHAIGRVVARDARDVLVDCELIDGDGTALACARASFRVRPRKPEGKSVADSDQQAAPGQGQQ